MKDKNAVKITITYDDGSTKEMSKGVCWDLPITEDGKEAEVVAELVGCSGRDLVAIVMSAIQLGERLGMFSDNQEA